MAFYVTSMGFPHVGHTAQGLPVYIAFDVCSRDNFPQDAFRDPLLSMARCPGIVQVSDLYPKCSDSV